MTAMAYQFLDPCVSVGKHKVIFICQPHFTPQWEAIVFSDLDLCLSTVSWFLQQLKMISDLVGYALQLPPCLWSWGYSQISITITCALLPGYTSGAKVFPLY